MPYLGPGYKIQHRVEIRTGSGVGETRIQSIGYSDGLLDLVNHNDADIMSQAEAISLGRAFVKAFERAKKDVHFHLYAKAIGAVLAGSEYTMTAGDLAEKFYGRIDLVEPLLLRRASGSRRLPRTGSSYAGDVEPEGINELGDA